MRVRIDKTRCHDLVAGIDAHRSLASGKIAYLRNHPRDDTNIGTKTRLAISINQRAVGDQQVEFRFFRCGLVHQYDSVIQVDCDFTSSTEPPLQKYQFGWRMCIA